jgi:hypothetical protein
MSDAVAVSGSAVEAGKASEEEGSQCPAHRSSEEVQPSEGVEAHLSSPAPRQGQVHQSDLQQQQQQQPGSETVSSSPGKRSRREERVGKLYSALEQLTLASIEPQSSSLLVVRGVLIPAEDKSKAVKVEPVQCDDILIDTGAAASFVSRTWVERHDVPVWSLSKPFDITLADGRRTCMTGAVYVAAVSTHGSVAPCTLIVMEQLTHDVILGLPWLRCAGVTLTFDQDETRWNGRRMSDWAAAYGSPQALSTSPRRSSAELSAASPKLPVDVKVGKGHEEVMSKILSRHRAAFSDDLPVRSAASQDDAIKCKVTLKDPQCKPVRDGERRLSFANKQLLIQTITEMEQAGLIRPSKSPWCSQPVMVKKFRDGVELDEKRWCYDYRRVNDLIVSDAYPLPLPENLFDELTGMRLFSKLDLTKGFWQIPLEEESKPILAMSTPIGLYEPNFMPFGMKNAPAVFQRVMQELLRDRLSKGVIVFMDDILLYSHTESEHEELVEWVVGQIEAGGFYAHPAKCEFFQREVSFLGHVVSERGVAVQQHKVKVVQQWPEPKTKKEVRAFLGLTGYYRKFIDNYGDIARSLYDLTKDEVTPHNFTWNDEAQSAFDQLKNLLASAPVLAHPDPTRQWIINSDASDFAIAAVLSQKQNDGTVRPVAYFSRAMRPAETRYTAIYDKELLALAEAVHHFRCYVGNGAFPLLLRTDHKGLTWLRTTKELSVRQYGWLEKLHGLEFQVEHIAGTANNAADALSRRADHQLQVFTIDASNKQVALNDTSGAVTFTLLDELRAAVPSHHWYAEKLKEQLPTDGLVREEGLLRSPCGQWYVPDDSSLKTKLLYEVHDAPAGGHVGAEKTLKKLQQHFYWAGMRGEVRDYVANCIRCQSVKSSQQLKAGLLVPLPIPSKPWDTISVDFVGPLPKSGKQGYDFILTVVDKFSKRGVFIPCHQSIDAPQTARKLLDHVIKDWGVPSRLISDRDVRWTGQVWGQLFAALGTKLKMSTSYHPQSDGQTERLNRTMEAGLRAYVNRHGTDWSRYLSVVEMAYNSSIHDATGHTPFELTGTDWVSPLSLALQSSSNPPPTSVVAREIWDGIKTAWEDARQSMEKARLRMKTNADKLRREERFVVGDRVMLSVKQLRKTQGKLDDPYVGPFTVKAVAENGVNVTLDLPPRYAGLHQPFHVEKLKKLPPSRYEWEGRVQDDRPLPELVDGQEMYEVEKIIGKKLETTIEMVYEDGHNDEPSQSSLPVNLEEKYADDRKEVNEEPDEREEQQSIGAWGGRLRLRPSRGVDSSSSKSRLGRVKRRKGKKQEVTVVKYLVKWKGYGEEESTWQRADELLHCQQAIDEYERGTVQKPTSSHDTLALQSMYVVTQPEPCRMDVTVTVLG